MPRVRAILIGGSSHGDSIMLDKNSGMIKVPKKQLPRVGQLDENGMPEKYSDMTEQYHECFRSVDGHVSLYSPTGESDNVVQIMARLGWIKSYGL